MASKHHELPYLPHYQIWGEVPTVIPDVPVNAIFLILFLLLGVGHGQVVYSNVVKGRKFVISFVVVVFCFIRILATSLRMAWACHPDDFRLDIASLFFLYTGVVLLYLINLTLAQRVVRAQHPDFGWRRLPSLAFDIAAVLTIIVFVCIIAGVIAVFYSRAGAKANAARGLEDFGVTMLAIMSTLPLLVVSSSTLIRRHPHIRMTKTMDKFGEGSMRAKVLIVASSSLLLSVSAWFRAGATLAEPTTPNTHSHNPKPGYLSKACFYVFIFTIEICVVMLWLFAHIDKRFHIPDGARGPHSYANGFVFAGEPGNEKKRVSATVSATPSEMSRPTSVRSVISLSRIPEADEDVVAPVPMSPTKSRRSSWAPSIVSRPERQAQLEKRISWGGVSREDVRDTTDEEGKVLRYQPFAESWSGGDTAADVGVPGTEKELGFDPESGRWAVRPVSSMNSVRVSMSRSVIYEME